LSTFNFEDFVGANQITEQTVISEVQPALAAINQEEEKRFFDLDLFIQEVYNKSTNKNKEMIEKQKYMSAYDVASSCINNILHKIRNTPIKNYANKWTPIVLRSYLGKSVHDFIQENSNQFTEQEVSLKVPSIRFSGRLDCQINKDVLVEIKSLPYKDYRKVIKDKAPRVNDFYQTLTYKYILENYLEEAKTHLEETRSQKPLLDSYNINHIQYVYVAHDILASDVESLDEAIKITQDVKKILNSKHNTFYFMCNLRLNLDEYDLTEHFNYIKNKIARVNYYLDNNLDVADNDEFVDPKACFFCLFGQNCKFKTR